MTTFYTDQIDKLNNLNAPLPRIKLGDSEGRITEWMHLTPECIVALRDYLEKIAEINKNTHN
jgi:hypothetical protein